MSKQKWVKVTREEELKPGMRVRYRDYDHEAWIGGDGDVRFVTERFTVEGYSSGTLVKWSLKELVTEWRQVEMLIDDSAEWEEAAFRFDPDKRIDPQEPTNGTRAEWAAGALGAMPGVDTENVDPDDIRDLIADLLHLCDREGIDGKKQIAVAVSNWELER